MRKSKHKEITLLAIREESGLLSELLGCLWGTGRKNLTYKTIKSIKNLFQYIQQQPGLKGWRVTLLLYSSYSLLNVTHVCFGLLRWCIISRFGGPWCFRDRSWVLHKQHKTALHPLWLLTGLWRKLQLQQHFNIWYHDFMNLGLSARHV